MLLGGEYIILTCVVSCSENFDQRALLLARPKLPAHFATYHMY